MWRFMAVSFAFLGWAFYQLSGGADYQPVSHSIQARAAEKARSAEVTDVVQVSALSSPSAPEAAPQPNEQVQVTLASATGTDGTLMPDVVQKPSRLETVAAIDAAIAEVMQDTSPVRAGEESEVEEIKEIFSLESYAEAVENGTLVVASDGTARLPEGDIDIREVSGSNVNMRSGPGKGYKSIGKLSRGTEIAVLETPGNGWLRFQVVETGVEGWMADWLVTAAN